MPLATCYLPVFLLTAREADLQLCFAADGSSCPLHPELQGVTEHAGGPLQALNKWGSWGYVAPGINNGQSEVDLHKLEFHRSASAAQAFEPDEQYTGLIQAVLFEVNDRDKIGYPTPQGYRYCCTKELVSKTACHIDRLIVKVRGCADQCQLGSAVHAVCSEAVCSVDSSR